MSLELKADLFLVRLTNEYHFQKHGFTNAGSLMIPVGFSKISVITGFTMQICCIVPIGDGCSDKFRFLERSHLMSTGL
jgi:hypothetical protein